MKTFDKISICVAISVIVTTFFSCTKEESQLQEASVIKATTELVVDPEAPKTSLGGIESGEYPILWSSGDAIAVSEQAGSNSAQYTLKVGAGTRYGEFEKTSGNEPSGAIYSYFPYSNVTGVSGSTYTVTIPATQVYAENSFSASAMPMYGEAASVSANIKFTPLLSTLKLQLKGTCKVKRIIVSSDTENLSGTATVDMTNGAISFTEGKKQVELTCNNVQLNESTATLFHICLPKTVSANKYKVFVVTSTNTVMVKSTGSTSFTAGVIKKMAELTFTPLKYPEGNADAIMFGNTVWAPENCGYNTDVTTHGIKGRLYQWGRSVGCYFNSTTQTSTKGKTDNPADNVFYTVDDTSPYDWKTTALSSWPMTDGKVGNPCPAGWRVPTVDEYGYLCYTDYNPSTKSGSTRRDGNTITSPLNGWRFNLGDGSYLTFYHTGSRAWDGNWSQETVAGTYSSSTANGVYAFGMVVATGNANRVWIDSQERRASGFAVRCVSTSSIQ